MVTVYRIVMFSIMLLFSGVSTAHDYTLGAINIDHPWSPQAAPKSQVLAIYFQIKNSGDKADFLIGASSSIAKKVEIHTHTLVDDVMKMSQLTKVKVKAKRLTLFRQGGLHLMLFEPKTLPKSGGKFQLTLLFKHAGKVELEVAVEDKGHQHLH